MTYLKQIQTYVPINDQELADKKGILALIDQYPLTILSRENPVAHITSSGFILNPTLDKTLFVHHNIYQSWAWTGGHVDGNPDLLAVAMAEAQEESGVSTTPLSVHMASLDILPVHGHVKNGVYVSTHLHLSVAYLLIADDSAPLSHKPDENSGVRWFDVADMTSANFSEQDVYLYTKLVNRARSSCLLR